MILLLEIIGLELQKSRERAEEADGPVFKTSLDQYLKQAWTNRIWIGEGYKVGT